MRRSFNTTNTTAATKSQQKDKMNEEEMVITVTQ
jgi:hypothetical protein